MHLYPLNVIFRWLTYFGYEMLFLVFRWPNGFLPKLGRRIAKWHLYRNDYLERMAVNNSHENFEFQSLYFPKIWINKITDKNCIKQGASKKIDSQLHFWM